MSKKSWPILYSYSYNINWVKTSWTYSKFVNCILPPPNNAYTRTHACKIYRLSCYSAHAQQQTPLTLTWTRHTYIYHCERYIQLVRQVYDCWAKYYLHFLFNLRKKLVFYDNILYKKLYNFIWLIFVNMIYSLKGWVRYPCAHMISLLPRSNRGELLTDLPLKNWTQ